MTLVAGVDTSTQSCKVLIVEAATGATVREGRAPHPDGTSVDPAAWWAAFIAAVDEAGGLADVEAIAVGGQQHGLVALDAEGRVVRDALLWNDTRSAAAAADLVAEVGAAAYAACTGSVPVASFTATKLRWMRDHEPHLVPTIAAVALPHDWLTWRLRGYGPLGESPLGPVLDELVTDRSDASGTAYWSPASGEYDLELFALALGRPAREADPHGASAGNAVILPRVLQPADWVTVDAATPSLRGSRAGVLVGPGAGDNAAAALGLGAGPGDVVISIGTSGTVFAVSPEPVTDESGTVAGFADAAGDFLPLVATLNAARVLDSVAGLLGVDHDGLADLALAAEPGAGGVVLLPYFDGERTPNLPDATATLSGLTLTSTTRENLARAAIEGMLCGLADGLDAIARHGLHPRRLLLVGGAARSRAVPAIASAVLGLPVVVPEPGEYVARGAARQAAGVLLGASPEWPLALHASVEHPSQPQVRAAYAAAFARSGH
ncbi:FGGY family carbohydrate kinase [Microcella sp.]|uniref:FGGY family carbohydrate kinase n=1 Tax=Microcella sp. TaxID=1913979 RepID=UPI00299F6585|nr:FGGY family carbohydrate kinase [Microcella sp.]MDX2026417.1 FGGY family carbohydrate kinase [Microcella sp.]